MARHLLSRCSVRIDMMRHPFLIAISSRSRVRWNNKHPLAVGHRKYVLDRFYWCHRVGIDLLGVDWTQIITSN